MAGNAKGKLRALFIMQMLQDETDDDHGLSMTDIIERLASYGMTADRKTIYSDLNILREFGLTIEMAQRNPVEYYLANRQFSINELMLMVDAVQSCQFITQTQADRMCRNLRMLATDNQREKLNRRIHVDNRVSGRNDAVLSNVDKIHEAIRAKKKIDFTYWKAGLDGKLHARHGGDVYTVTPMHVTFSENHYYLTAWSDKEEEIREYRIDRMQDMGISGERAHRCKEIYAYSYQARDYQYFGRFDGPVTKVTLRVEEDLMPTICDRFGSEMTTIVQKDGTSNVHVTVRVSPQFFGWVAGMSGHVQIAAPKSLVTEYQTYLKGLLEGSKQFTLTLENNTRV